MSLHCVSWKTQFSRRAYIPAFAFEPSASSALRRDLSLFCFLQFSPIMRQSIIALICLRFDETIWNLSFLILWDTLFTTSQHIKSSFTPVNRSVSVFFIFSYTNPTHRAFLFRLLPFFKGCVNMLSILKHTHVIFFPKHFLFCHVFVTFSFAAWFPWKMERRLPSDHADEDKRVPASASAQRSQFVGSSRKSLSFLSRKDVKSNRFC